MVNEEKIINAIKAEIKDQIEKTCEPFIKKALEDAENQIRKDVSLFAGMAVNKYFDIKTNSNQFEVIVRLMG